MEVDVFPRFQDKKDPEYYNTDLNKALRDEFDKLEGITYVDHAATTIYSTKQIASMVLTLNSGIFGNPHSRHLPSVTVTEEIEATRSRILEHFNVTSDDYDVIFTSGATEAIKIVADCFCWMENLTKESSWTSGFFVYTQENHTSVLGIREVAARKGVSVYCREAKKIKEYLDLGIEDSHQLSSSSSHIALFAYPGQCNYSGSKYPVDWICKVHEGQLNGILKEAPMNKNHGGRIPIKPKWFVLYDAACLCATSPLDLAVVKPDFIPISFYKIFGYPTGLGCLLVSKRAENYLHKNFFGGGTVQVADTRSLMVRRKMVLHERFEDGTLPFLSILALEHGFNTLKRIAGSMKAVEDHTFSIAHYFYLNLCGMRHRNDTPVSEIYSEEGVQRSKCTQGPIVNFSILDSLGNYIGFTQVEKVSSLYNVYLRTGCMCNPGACQKYLKISTERLQQQLDAGHVCGDSIDLVDGHPTGSIRVSFGYMSTYEDADRVLHMIKDCFIESPMIFHISEDLSNVENGVEANDYSVTSSYGTSIRSIVATSDSIPENTERTYIECETNGKCYIEDSSKYQLRNIIVYPVKSCSGISSTSWRMGSRGLEYDRQWMIVNESGITLTQKRAPKMSLIQPYIDLQNNCLRLEYKGYKSVEVSLQSLSEDVADTAFCGGRVCGDRVLGYDCGSSVASWLCEVLQMKCLRLLKQVKGRRSKFGSELENLSLANESQYLIIHLPSIRLLLSQIMKKGIETSLNEEDLQLRFRPNLIIDGGEPYEEDSWRFISIGENKFKVHGTCTRCQMVSLSQDTGEKTREPLLTLCSTRGSNMKFGIHASFMNSALCEVKANYFTVSTNMAVSVQQS